MTITYSKSSPYYKTPQVNKYVNYLDYWKSITINPASNDTLIQLDSKYNNRPDLLSYDYYGTPNLWWVFIVRNPDVLKDPIYDFVTDIYINVPDKSTLGAYL